MCRFRTNSNCYSKIRIRFVSTVIGVSFPFEFSSLTVAVLSGFSSELTVIVYYYFDSSTTLYVNSMQLKF